MRIQKIYNKLKNLTRIFSKKRIKPSVLIDYAFLADNAEAGYSKHLLNISAEDKKLQSAFYCYCKQNGFGVRK